MTNSQKQFNTDLKEAQVIADPTVPVNVTNIMLGYDGCDNVSGHAVAPLVSTLFNTIKTQKLARLRVLLTAVVSGDPDKAKAILEQDPSLLYEKLEEGQFVTAPSGHKFNLKPYQAALSVDDTQMAEMVKSYFAKLHDEKEADKQFGEQCPKEWETAEEKKWKPILDQHDNTLRTICDSKNGDIISSGDPDYIITVKKGSPVEQELLEFWRLLDATLNEVITTGKRPFNSNLLSKALQLYDDEKNYEDYFGGRWDDPRALLFVQQVIGYNGIQRIMPVNYVQAFQDGLANTTQKLQKQQPQGRSTRFEIYHSGNLVPLDFYPLQLRGYPGFNIAERAGGGWSGRGNSAAVVGGWRMGSAAFLKLMSVKSRLTELMSHQRDYRSESTKSFCEIM
jgi:hypothetical protein